MQLQEAKTRLAYLDWLRIIIVLMLVPFHTAMTFAPYPWFLQNNQMSLPLQGLVMVMDRYHMPMLFLIAGVAVYFSLGLRGWKGFAVERLLRLVVPLVFGMLVLVPACYWVGARNQYDYTGAIWEYYPLFWQKNMLPSPVRGVFTPGVLWFLWYLVMYVAVLPPLFILLMKKAGSGFFNRLGRPFASPWMVFALFIPIALQQAFSDNGIVGWCMFSTFGVFYYMIFFIYGLFLFTSDDYGKGLQRAAPAAIVIALLSMVMFMLMAFPSIGTAPLNVKFWAGLNLNMRYAVYVIKVVMALCTWSCLIALLYLAKRYLNFSNTFTRYGNEAVLPYYVFHGTAIALAGYWIVAQPWGVWEKYGLIVLLAFLATLGFYELMKQTNITRVLLGMRWKAPDLPARRSFKQALAVNALAAVCLVPLIAGIMQPAAVKPESLSSQPASAAAVNIPSVTVPADTGAAAATLPFAPDSYKNDELGFTISYPKSWKAGEVQAAHGIFLAVAEMRLPLLTISVHDADNLEQQQYEDLQKQNLTDIRAEAPQPYNLSDGQTKGLYVTSRLRHPQVDLISRTLYVKRDEKVLIFSVVSADGYEPGYVSDIFKTIRFYR